jgi:two-component system response regulator FixJ
VDDNERALMEMTGLLERQGYRAQSFTSGEDFLSARLPIHLGCVLLDVRMPGMSGLDVLRLLNERGNRPAVLIMSGCGDIAMAVEAMRLGAFDFLEKPFSAAALLAAVEKATEYHMHSQASLDGNRDAAALVAGLSERQRQVLTGIVKGRPNKLIAYDLGLSIRTIESYRAHLLTKLGVHSTAEAVRIAIAASTVGIAFSWDGPGSGPAGRSRARPRESGFANDAAGEPPISRQHRPAGALQLD